MITLGDVLDTTPIQSYKGYEAINELFYMDGFRYFIHELSELQFNASTTGCDAVELHLLAYYNVNFDRGVSVYGIKFENEWVMVTHGSGRGRSDYTKRFVVNADLLMKLIEYIRREYHQETIIEETPLDTDMTKYLQCGNDTVVLGVFTSFPRKRNLYNVI